MKDGPKKFRELLARGGLIVAPGVYDGYSARLVEKAGFEMAATTGAGISNCPLASTDISMDFGKRRPLPDAGAHSPSR